MNTSVKQTRRRGLLILALLIPMAAWSQVRITEETMMIPTYPNTPPNPMPRFYEGRSHQGVQRRIYPYPYDDNMTSARINVAYPFIHVENEYIDLGIMPHLGGRIYFAVDKTNGYKWLYHNEVVKPSLIGMAGNWISGSLAWGYPHHHGPNTVEPMDYTLEEHADGGKTVWIATTDLRHRLSILVGYTVRPGSSIVEMTIHPLNKTALGHSFLFWANPAVHCDSAYQVIFPPSVQYVTFHGKRDMTAWPVADSWFNGYNFTGMDVSWWKNTRIPSSFFSWDPREDYFGGYDHGRDAGTVWVGNHYVSPGMKYWADGNNPTGERINRGLTDHSGRYIELMAGFYTDNQPDYSWLQPYETKCGSMIWFPVRELGGLKYANRNGALNLEVQNRSVKLRINATSPVPSAVLLVKTIKGNVLLEKGIDIGPDKPLRWDAPVPAALTEDDLDVSLKDQAGNVVLAYRPREHHPPDHPRPEPLKPLPQPGEIKSTEELYLAGLRLNQFYNASVDAMPYYLEALKRDSCDYRVNTQLGILCLKDYKWERAERHLQTAVERITSNYTRPKDGEALYYRGIAAREQGKPEEAYSFFYQASWSSAWHSASYYQLSEIDCIQKDWTTALDHLDRSLSTNTDHPKALNLKTLCLRKLKQLAAARETAVSTLQRYRIDHQALHELYLIDSLMNDQAKASQDFKALSILMRDNIQSYLELACSYQNAGCIPEAAQVLRRLERKGCASPMLYYYLGYYSAREGSDEQALAYFQKAEKMPSDYCFPSRAEEIAVLECAGAMNPKGARAPYVLGNLLYEHQPEKALLLWEKSRGLDPSFYIVHRNLGIAYRDIQKDYTKALASLIRAESCTNDDPRLLVEVDALNELNKVSAQKKYDFLKARAATAGRRSDALLRLATRSVENERYDEAIAILTTNTIRESEGARELQDAYINAYVLRGLQNLHSGDIEQARKDIETAQAYPSGLVGRGRTVQFHYLLGLVEMKTGHMEQARILFWKAAESPIGREGSDREYLYYQGMALKELGKAGESEKLFSKMLEDVQGRKGENTFFTQFEGGLSEERRAATHHYLLGLAYKGLGKRDQAKSEFAETRRINPGHIWSKVHLDSLE